MAIKLPERNYFTFPELMIRWQCTERDIFHLIIDKKLVPSYFFSEDLNVYDQELLNEMMDDPFDENQHIPLKLMTNSFWYLVDPILTTAHDLCFFRISRRRETNDQYQSLESDNFELCKRSFTFENVMEQCAVMMSEVALIEGNVRESSAQKNEPKPMSTKEMNSLLKIIATLCKEAKLDYSTSAKTAGLIASMAASIGVSIGETTIENYLKKIPNAL